MATVCPICFIVHPPGVIDCRRAIEENRIFTKRVDKHRNECVGCPDPAEHVRRLDRLRKTFSPIY